MEFIWHATFSVSISVCSFGFILSCSWTKKPKICISLLHYTSQHFAVLKHNWGGFPLWGQRWKLFLLFSRKWSVHWSPRGNQPPEGTGCGGISLLCSWSLFGSLMTLCESSSICCALALAAPWRSAILGHCFKLYKCCSSLTLKSLFVHSPAFTEYLCELCSCDVQSCTNHIKP